MQLSRRLRQLINHQDLTVAELSKRSGVPVNTLQNWLAGQVPRNMTQVKQVADYFHVTLDYLAFGEEMRLDKESLPELLMSGKYEIVLRATIHKRGEVK